MVNLNNFSRMYENSKTKKKNLFGTKYFMKGS